jgi:hypothetical protein
LNTGYFFSKKQDRIYQLHYFTPCISTGSAG